VHPQEGEVRRDAEYIHYLDDFTHAYVKKYSHVHFKHMQYFNQATLQIICNVYLENIKQRRINDIYNKEKWSVEGDIGPKSEKVFLIC
jgi:hypothetical protein